MTTVSSDIVTGAINRSLPSRIAARFGGGVLRIALIVIALLWLLPTFGLLVESLRNPGQYANGGWWQVFVHPAQLTVSNYTSLLQNGTITGSLLNTVKITVPGPFTMAQQAQNDYYTSTQQLAMAYAEAVNAEVADLFAAGADIVQLDEPYLQARPEEARRYGVAAVNRALAGISGTTAVHLCFGYAAIIHDRPSGYSFLPELAAADCDQVSVETAQAGLDCSVLASLTGKTVILGVLNLGDHAVEAAADVVARVRRALPYVPPERLVLAPDCGMKYLPRDAAYGKLCAMTAAAAVPRAEFAARPGSGAGAGQ